LQRGEFDTTYNDQYFSSVNEQFWRFPNSRRPADANNINDTLSSFHGHTTTMRLRRTDSSLHLADSSDSLEGLCFLPKSRNSSSRVSERRSSKQYRKLLFLFPVLIFFLGRSVDALFFFRMDPRTKNLRGTITYRNQNRTGAIAVAHLGNSIQYYNDCPRFLEHMLNEKYASVTQDSCLRGGANVTGLYAKGNGMKEKFATPNAKKADGTTYDVGSPTVVDLLAPGNKWDYVVINDHTQAPVRQENKTDSIQTFKEHYIPLIGDDTTVILLMTAAYKAPVNNSTDLGGFDHFTELLVKGYAEYATLFQAVKIAPLGLAFQYIKHHPGAVEWGKLYAPDDFHPSPHGTYLEACILYCTITGERPPEYNQLWWKTARYMQPPAVQPPMPLPTEQEAEFLREVASKLCNITAQSSL
jgi:hypothetical protein